MCIFFFKNSVKTIFDVDLEKFLEFCRNLWINSWRHPFKNSWLNSKEMLNDNIGRNPKKSDILLLEFLKMLQILEKSLKESQNGFLEDFLKKFVNESLKEYLWKLLKVSTLDCWKRFEVNFGGIHLSLPWEITWKFLGWIPGRTSGRVSECIPKQINVESLKYAEYQSRVAARRKRKND